MPPSLKIAMPETFDVGNLFSKFEGCTVFRFRVNGGHDIRTDRPKDGV